MQNLRENSRILLWSGKDAAFKLVTKACHTKLHQNQGRERVGPGIWRAAGGHAIHSREKLCNSRVPDLVIPPRPTIWKQELKQQIQLAPRPRWRYLCRWSLQDAHLKKGQDVWHLQARALNNKSKAHLSVVMVNVGDGSRCQKAHFFLSHCSPSNELPVKPSTGSPLRVWTPFRWVPSLPPCSPPCQRDPKGAYWGPEVLVCCMWPTRYLAPAGKNHKMEDFRGPEIAEIDWSHFWDLFQPAIGKSSQKCSEAEQPASRSTIGSFRGRRGQSEAERGDVVVDQGRAHDAWRCQNHQPDFSYMILLYHFVFMSMCQCHCSNLFLGLISSCVVWNTVVKPSLRPWWNKISDEAKATGSLVFGTGVSRLSENRVGGKEELWDDMGRMC